MEQTEAASNGHAPAAPTAPDQTDRRHSTRLSIAVPVFLAGKDSSGATFREECWTATISRHGATLKTSRVIAPGTELLIQNPSLGITVRARALRYVQAQSPGDPPEIAVRLIDLKNVWGIQYPPRDWAFQTPAAPKIESLSLAAPAANVVEFDLGGLALRTPQSADPKPAPAEDALRRQEESQRAMLSLEQRVASLVETVTACCAGLERAISRAKEAEQQACERAERLLEQSAARVAEQQALIAAGNQTQMNLAMQSALAALLGQLLDSGQGGACPGVLKKPAARAARSKPKSPRRAAKTEGDTA